MTDAQKPAIVFDFGGVLMDWNPRYLYRKIFDDSEAMERFLEEVEFGAWNEEQDRGRPFAEGVAVLSARFPHYRAPIEAFHHRWEETVAGEIAGTVEILASLRDSGYPLFGLSNWSAETFALVRDHYPFFSWFDEIILSGEEKVCKPDAGLFHVLLERSGRSAGECVFIDDSLPNITAARALGFQVVHFRDPDQLREALTARDIFV